MPLETLYRHVLAQEQGVEVWHAVDRVDILGFRESALIEVRLIMGVEEFFDAEIPIEALETGAKGERDMMQEYRSNSYLFGGNAPYVEELYEAYLDNPGSVPENWRAYESEGGLGVTLAPEGGVTQDRRGYYMVARLKAGA